MKKILVVDDDGVFRMAIKSVLEDCGKFVIVEAESGIEAKKFILSEEIDLVLSDVEMPKLNGMELLKWVRETQDPSMDNKRKTPFIIMTGYSEIIDANPVFEYGASEFMKKPFEDDDLISMINKIIGYENKPC